jgi:aminoglycoside phosphotransferase (APT) family kinase protein
MTNFNHRLRLDDDRRLLLRIYGDASSRSARRQTELAAHSLVAALNIPAPHIIAAPPGADDFSILEWVEGARLRDAFGTERDPGRLQHAWLQTGQALRAIHAVTAASDREAFSRAGGSALDNAEWCAFHTREINECAAILVNKKLITASDEKRLAALAARASELVGSFQASLVHGDAHAANVMVRDETSGWVLAAWIDWERAEFGDPESDLATFEVFTRSQVGRTPNAFWDGYGRSPNPGPFKFYELHKVLGLASNDHAQVLPPGREARRLITTSMVALLEALED